MCFVSTQTPKDLPDYDMDEEDFKFFNEELRERRKFEVEKVFALLFCSQSFVIDRSP